MSLLVFLLAFSENLDSQIPGNKKHSSRVGYTSLNIANALGLSEERKYSLLISSLLHDAGDGKIVSEKDMTIPEHALKGNIFIEDVPFLEKPAAIIKYHHIPWDFGKGSIYEEEEIPIESHILHLAEFIDNYIDKDKYILKEKSKVIKKIKEEKDAIFNPDVVDTFLDLSSKEAFWFEINYDTIDPSSFKNDLQLDLDELLLLSKAIARIVDFRSKIQVRHSKNVAAISYFIGENLKLPKEKIE
ncbi:MAG TPA: HD domain-containing protein, partial [Dictyoglomaceae bacterium]|nr:HD domain-containing protein [Dictyoglomaceae bacterium]